MGQVAFDKVAKVGKWEVSISSEQNRGYFEHDIFGEGGGLWFTEDKVLFDYDGVFELPKDVITAIEQLGFDAEYAKDDADA